MSVNEHTCQAAVLFPEGFDWACHLLVFSLVTEELGRVAAAFFLGILKLSLQGTHLGLPLSDGLVKAAVALVELVDGRVGSVKVNCSIFELSLWLNNTRQI